MSAENQTAARPPQRRRGPMGPGMGMGMPGEKAKDLKGSGKRLVGLLRPERTRVVGVFVLGVLSVAAGSLMRTGSDSTYSMSGSRVMPAAAASARMMRSIAASTRSRTWGSAVRTESISVAVSGMMLCFVPAWTAPTVTTTRSAAATSRATTVCSRTTTDAAATTGSTVASGREPCPPAPYSVTVMLSAPAMAGPAWKESIPAGSGTTCWPSSTEGRGKRSATPSATIAPAPAPISSAGWK